MSNSGNSCPIIFVKLEGFVEAPDTQLETPRNQSLSLGSCQGLCKANSLCLAIDYIAADYHCILYDNVHNYQLPNYQLDPIKEQKNRNGKQVDSYILQCGNNNMSKS